MKKKARLGGFFTDIYITAMAVLICAIAVFAICLVMFVISLCRFPFQRKLKTGLICGFSVVTMILAVVMILFILSTQDFSDPSLQIPTDTTVDSQPSQSTTTTVPSTEPTVPTIITQPTEPTQPSEPTDPTEPVFSLGTVYPDESANPKNWNIQWEVFVNGQIADHYEAPEPVYFEQKPYFSLPGICTFRGDTSRGSCTYGTADIRDQSMSIIWDHYIGKLPAVTGGGYWTGCGWTGQPLIVQWDADTRNNMNIFDHKKQKENLVEVIYATLDGNIYFYDLHDGTPTREPLNIGMPFKGSGSLDPRGYPILYVGSGDKTADGEKPRMYISNLMDCTVAYTYGNEESDNVRPWIAFDSAPIVHAESDTLIWPGECGILYTFRLNSEYDAKTGNLSISVDAPVKIRYSSSTGHKVGFEASCIAVENYLYIADNGGLLFCVDMNTLALVWAQNVKDDTNATPVFEWGADGRGYLYNATSSEYCSGNCYVQKIDAATGKILWETEFTGVFGNHSISGGIMTSPILGKPGTALEGMLIYSISRCPGKTSGLTFAISTEDGHILWEKSMERDCWCSPAAVYNEAGDAWMIIGDRNGYLYMMDPLTGEILSSVFLGMNIESSPAVYQDILVIGTRGQNIYGIKLK